VIKVSQIVDLLLFMQQIEIMLNLAVQCRQLVLIFILLMVTQAVLIIIHIQQKIECPHI